MKKKMCLLIVLLCAVIPVLSYASGLPDTVTPSETTNGLSLAMSLSDYVKSYNEVLMGTVPQSDNLFNESDQLYIEAAKTLLTASLTNPSAATIHDAAVYEMDPYGRFCIWFDVTESAAFGTFTRGSYYVFVQGLDPDGMISYVEGYAVLAGDDPGLIQ